MDVSAVTAMCKNNNGKNHGKSSEFIIKSNVKRTNSINK